VGGQPVQVAGPADLEPGRRSGRDGVRDRVEDHRRVGLVGLLAQAQRLDGRDQGVVACSEAHLEGHATPAHLRDRTGKGIGACVVAHRVDPVQGRDRDAAHEPPEPVDPTGRAVRDHGHGPHPQLHLVVEGEPGEVDVAGPLRRSHAAAVWGLASAASHRPPRRRRRPRHPSARARPACQSGSTSSIRIRLLIRPFDS
jgi:hypothetical protein